MPTTPPLFEPRPCTEPRSTNPLYLCPPLLPYSNPDLAPSPDQLTRSTYAPDSLYFTHSTSSHHISPISPKPCPPAPIIFPALLRPPTPPLFPPTPRPRPRSTNPLYFCPPLLPYSNRDLAPSPDQLTRSTYAHHSSPIRTETLHRAPIN